MTSAISKVLRHIYFFPPSPLRVLVCSPKGGFLFVVWERSIYIQLYMNVHGFIYTVDRVVKRLDPPFVVGRILWIIMLKVYYDCILLHCRCCVNPLFKPSWRLQYMDFKIKKGIHPYMVNPFTWGKKWIWNSFLSEWIPPSCILMISCYSMTKMLSIGISKKFGK